VSMTGSGFAANSALSATFAGSALTLSGATTTNAAGAVSGTTFAVPGSLSAGSAYPVALDDAAGNRAIALFTVDQAAAVTSAASAAFVLGSAGSFTVTASGFPSPGLSESGALPGGVTFTASNGQLAGTPTGPTGTFPITLTASNGVGADATQAFTLSVGTAPVITSAASATFAVGSAGSFTAVATGAPAPTFSESGSLPSGVTLAPSGVLAGTPAAASGGAYPITLSATSAAGSATQAFMLTVDQAPAITSSAAATFAVHVAGSFSVSATGTPAPTFSETGALPSGVSLGSTGLLSGTPGSAGSYPITISATNGVGGGATQSFTLTVSSFTIGGIQFVQGTPTRATFSCTAAAFTSVSCSASGTGSNLTGQIELFAGSDPYHDPEAPLVNTSGSPIVISSSAVSGGGTPNPATVTIPTGSADSNGITLVRAGSGSNVWTFTYVLNSTTYALTLTVS
jgi:hypothetical protein